ncbi:Flp family type IVb pilin [Zobellella sp. DQSA1]|uniref:Flp family type IVb pilin n=1 Tax=Zobellella sp. DQSA1 TaxID=3342386 RepID=UPI0035BF7EB5
MQNINGKIATKRQRGLTMVEYALAGALLSATVALSFTALSIAVDASISQLAGLLAQLPGEGGGAETGTPGQDDNITDSGSGSGNNGNGCTSSNGKPKKCS